MMRIRFVSGLAATALIASIATGCSSGSPTSAARRAPLLPPGMAQLPLGASAAVGATLGRADHEYWVHGLQAANPAQRLRFGFSERGVRVASGRGAFGLSLVAFGRGGAESAVGPAAPQVSADRVVYDHGALREWYTNSPLGLEQGFDVARAPAGTGGVLVFSIAVRGDLPPRLNGAAVQFTGAGASLRYGELSAFDASGRRLPASIAVRGGQVVLSVDARGARYPLRVDPSITQYTQAALLSTGPGTGADTGVESVALSGNTLVVGAPGVKVGTNQYQGAVYVYTEPAGGWASTSTPTATLTASDGAGGDSFGTSVAIDGGTIVASAPSHYMPMTINQGAVYVFTGGGSTWTQAAELTATAPKDAGTGPIGDHGALAISGNTIVAGTGNDVNAQEGLYVYNKPGGGWTSTGTPSAELTAPNPSVSVGLGSAGVAMTADTIVAGAPNSPGAAYVYVNGGGGWPTTPTAVLTGSDTGSGDALGTSVAISGSTVVAGDPRSSSSTFNGSAYVYTEPAGGWTSETQTAELSVPFVGSDQIDTYHAGTAVGIAGNAILAGAPDAPGVFSANSQNGGVFVFNEPQSGWANSSTPTAELVSAGFGSQGKLGEAVAAAGTTVFAGAPQAFLHGVPATYEWNGPFTSAPTFTLSVSVAGTGHGTVTGSGISCPGTCQHDFTSGTVVTLTAAPAAGSSFAGWSGGGCSGNGTTCRVTMSAARTAQAVFNASAPPPPKPSCTLKAVSGKVTAAKPKHGKQKPGTVSLTARCDQTVSATLKGTVKETIGKKPHQKTFTVHLATVHATLTAGAAKTLKEQIPASLILALRRGAKESATFVLTFSDRNGSGRATTAILSLHL